MPVTAINQNYLFEILILHFQYRADHSKMNENMIYLENDCKRMKKILEMRMNEEEWKSELMFNRGIYTLQNQMKEYNHRLKMNETVSNRLRKEFSVQQDQMNHLKKEISTQKGRITKLKSLVNQYLLEDADSNSDT